MEANFSFGADYYEDQWELSEELTSEFLEVKMDRSSCSSAMEVRHLKINKPLFTSTEKLNTNVSNFEHPSKFHSDLNYSEI